MIKGTIRALLVGGIIMMGIATTGFTQEADDLQFAFGSVVKIAADEIVILEYDFDDDVDKEVTYKVDSESVLVGIHVGDDVDIEYVEVNGERIANAIYKSELEDVQDLDEVSVGSSEDI